MTDEQRQIIHRCHDRRDPRFNIDQLIEKIVFAGGEEYVEFNNTSFSSKAYVINGRIRQKGEGVRFTLESSIIDTSKERYTYALLLAVYMEFIQYEHRANITVYITDEWEAISDDLDLVGSAIQRKIRRVARRILINENLFDETLSVRELAREFGVPRPVILEQLEEYAY